MPGGRWLCSIWGCVSEAGGVLPEYIVAIDQETDIARRTLAMQHLRAAYLKLAGFYRQNEEFDKTIEALRARASQTIRHR